MMDALGMNEVMSIPTGFLVCDTMLKAANVTLISSGCVCAGKYYTVVSGDCLWNIAQKFYGTGAEWTIIYEANKDTIKNPDQIWAGQILVIPAK